jgi:hypothetical protein
LTSGLTSGRTLDYVEICPHNLPDSLAGDVKITSHRVGLDGSIAA